MSQIAGTTEELGETLAREHPDLYENYILAACNLDNDFWIKISKYLCVRDKGEYKMDTNDFTSVVRYALFLALREWKNAISEANSALTPVTATSLQTMLLLLSMQPSHIVAEDRIKEVMTYWTENIASISKEEALSMVGSTWSGWIVGRKSVAVMKDIQRMDGATATGNVQYISRLASEVANTAEEDSLISFSALKMQKEQIIERIPLPPRTWANLNNVLGGGLGKREHTIFVAPSGGGKTVLACQLAAEVAYSGKNVLLITTEQHPAELMPRIISSMSFSAGGSRIPFKLIKDGGDYTKILSEGQYAAYTNICTRLGSHLYFENWTDGRTTVSSLTSRVERVERICAAREECVDLVILDWIGGSLAESTTDQQKRRLLFLSAADEMKRLALAKNVACVSMAQATPDAVKKAHITAQDIAECHSLHTQATVGIGVSAMLNTGGDSDSAASVQEKQYMFCFKSRKAEGMFFPILRNFAYQRFDKP